MSVEIMVFLDVSRMPSTKQWAAAIRGAGFDMELDTDFDTKLFSGFLPCKYMGKDAGFEYFYQSTTEISIEADAAVQIGSRDIAISFVTHADLNEFTSSIIASGVLCSLTDGILWETESDIFITSGEAIEWSKKV